MYFRSRPPLMLRGRYIRFLRWWKLFDIAYPLLSALFSVVSCCHPYLHHLLSRSKRACEEFWSSQMGSWSCCERSGWTSGGSSILLRVRWAHVRRPQFPGQSIVRLVFCFAWWTSKAFFSCVGDMARLVAVKAIMIRTWSSDVVQWATFPAHSWLVCIIDSDQKWSESH